MGGAAYAVKRWISDSKPASTSGEGEAQGPVRKMEGMKEGEWFERWEGTIRRAVVEGRIDRVPMQEPTSQLTGPQSGGEFLRLV